MAISIVLTDDHPLVRQGFAMIISQQHDMKVVGEASDPEEAVRTLREMQPDILITDISMGTEKSGLLLVERVQHDFPDVGIIVLSMHEQQEYLRQAFERGASAYVLKSASDEELIKAIRTTHADELYVSESMMSSFVRDTLKGADPSAKALTPRESEIVVLAVRGYSNKEIGESLHISIKTVESQKAKIMLKLGISSKPELFEYALAHNLIVT